LTVQEHTEQNWLKVLTADARTLASFHSKISPMDGVLIHHRVTPRIKFASTQVYTAGWGGAL